MVMGLVGGFSVCSGFSPCIGRPAMGVTPGSGGAVFTGTAPKNAEAGRE